MKNPIKILKLDAHMPRACGEQHGEELRQKIREIAEIRYELLRKDCPNFSPTDIMNVAQAHLPILQKYDRDLFEELLGISHGSGVSPERIVIVNNYTDMRDIKAPGDQGCSVMYAPTHNGPVLGQTWDIHGSAINYSIMLHIKQKDESEILMFSLAGCLGLTGFSSHNVAVCINNLASIDAKVGIVWPAVVRKILMQKSAFAGLDVVMHAPLGSGHHYTVVDKRDIFAIETSGTKKKVTHSNHEQVHIHTNHCLDEEMAKTHSIRKGSTTFERYKHLEDISGNNLPSSGAEMFEAFGRVSVAPSEKDIHQVATCGALVMELDKLRAYACKGPPSSKFNNEPVVIELK